MPGLIAFTNITDMLFTIKFRVHINAKPRYYAKRLKYGG